jgi:hypothetical protein
LNAIRPKQLWVPRSKSTSQAAEKDSAFDVDASVPAAADGSVLVLTNNPAVCGITKLTVEHPSRSHDSGEAGLGVARDLGYEVSDVLSLLALNDVRGHRSVAQADRAVVPADLSLQAAMGDRVEGQ